MAERSNAAVLKTVVPARVPGVRIPLSPQLYYEQEIERSLVLFGEMPERSNGAVSKTVVLRKRDRGFESLSLRIIFNMNRIVTISKCEDIFQEFQDTPIGKLIEYCTYWSQQMCNG